MAILRVLVEKLLCQAMMGLILVLECLLLGVHGRLWVRPFKPGIKCYCFLRTRLHGHLPDIGEPQMWLPGAQVYAESGLGGKADWTDR
jgi:hypothetical protein